MRIRDPGWKKSGSGMEKFGSGINIPDPQHWLIVAGTECSLSMCCVKQSSALMSSAGNRFEVFLPFFSSNEEQREIKLIFIATVRTGRCFRKESCFSTNIHETIPPFISKRFNGYCYYCISSNLKKN